MTSDIYDSEGNRIGVMTVTGPIFSMSPEDLEAVREASEGAEAARAEELRKVSREGREQRMARLLDIAEIHPSMMIDRLDQLTFEERKLIQYALQGGDSVNLPYAVSNVLKTREKQGHKRHAVEVALDRASRRLYNRGLATVQKKDDGLVWVTVSRERLLDALHRELMSSRPPGEQDFNLMKVPCEIQTSDFGVPGTVTKTLPGKVSRDPLAMPKRCSSQRLQACRLLTGIRTLERADKAEINYLFEVYSDETNQKIIALLDARSGEVIGSEYSTRFNDLAKAARNLNRFDYALAKSLRDHYKAVFLTLTTDPNLTDEERAANRERSRRSIMAKLSNPALPQHVRASLQKALYKVEGPDYEIADLEACVASGTLKAGDVQAMTNRIEKLKRDREEAERLKAQLEDPSVGIRTKERIVQSLKRMGRWEYRHDPNGFQNLWEADRSFSPAWNRFMSYLKKKNNGKRPQYLAAFEFTESGLLHIHVLIFLEYLLPNDQISLEWRRCGQGEITYIYALKNVFNPQTKQREWRWNSHSRPTDAKGMSGGDYLKKYIKKCALALMDSYTSPADTHSMYWALNKRMHTCSRSLMEGYVEGSRVKVGEDEKKDETAFSLFKILTPDEAEDVVDRMVYHRIRPGWQNPEDPPDPQEVMA